MDSFNNFISATTDPYWVVLATFISGLAIGFLISSVSTFVDYLVQCVHRWKKNRRIEK